jgi:hypothetical protein
LKIWKENSSSRRYLYYDTQILKHLLTLKKLFNQIQTRLTSVHATTPEGHALKRIHTLSGLISGMIRKGSSHLPDIGSGIPKNIDARSKTTAAKRFLANKWTDYTCHFLPYLTAFIRGVLCCITDLSQGITLVIDGSQMGKDNAALMVSLVWQGRGIPICWVVKKGGKGHFKVADHVQVLSEAISIMRPLLPADIPVTVLGDGEFDSIKLQELCLANEWNYVLRTARNTVFFEQGERFQAKAVCPDQTHTIHFMTELEFTAERFATVNFVCWHDHHRHEEPIYLISNLSCPGQIIDYYDQRYSIECLFKDLKSTSFNLHKTRLKDPQELDKLIIIAALAFLLLTVLAIQYDKPQWRKKVQRVRKDRKVLSFFTFAYRLIDFFIDHDVGFCFSFQFSKNFDDFFLKDT